MQKFNEVTIDSLRSIIFLCGTHYRERDIKDKRNVLKKYLCDEYPALNVLILEEHFVFGKKRGYLSYDNIFMKNLNDIEEMTAAFSDGIIIIHDSISTGAELAAFASNDFLEDKICVLEPDSTGIEERKISAFLELAYFGDDSKIERITYYPEVYSFEISSKHIEKRTNFAKNMITPVLGSKINKFVSRCNKELSIRFEKMICRKINRERGVISYAIDNSKLLVYVSGQVVLYQMMGLFTDGEVKKELREKRKLYQYVDYLHSLYRKVLCSTIQEKVVEDIKDIEVIEKETNKEVRDVIAYSLYMLQALGVISIHKEHELNRIAFKKDAFELLKDFQSIIGHREDDILELLNE